MPGIIPVSPKQAFADAAGGPLANGTVTVYLAGTTTPTPTWQDTSQSVLNTNPIVLDARGECLIWLDPVLTYKFLLKDSTGATIYTVDNIYGAAGNASALSYTPAGIGAVTTTVQAKLRESVSAFDFMTAAQVADVQAGALTLDVTAALQAAIDAVFAKPTRGSVYLPTGAYRISNNLDMKYGVSMFGAGGTASILHCYACNGIDFVTYGTSIGDVFFEDFGITAASGTNWAAIAVPTNASSMDGLFFSRLRIYGFNEGIYLGASRSTTISDCVFQNINTCISTQGEIIKLRVNNNAMTYASGGAGSASLYGIDLRAATFLEDVQIFQNEIYGFERCVNVVQALAMNVTSNILSGNSRVISFVTANGGFNFSDNYIEVLGSGTGIYGASQGSDTPLTLTNIQKNYIVGSGGSSAVGIQLNTAVSTFQWNANISDNMITGFATNDMAIYEPGRTTIVNNRCLSTAPTNSILIGNVIAGPVFLSKNWMKKALSALNPADITTGKLILDQNTTADTFVPYSGTWTATYAPTTGAFGTIVYGARTGTYHRIGNMVFFNLTIFETTHTASTGAGDLLITGLPFTSTANTTVPTPISVSDSRLWTANNPSSAHVLNNSTSIKLYYRTTANGANTLLQCSDMGAGVGTFNLVTLAGVYQCV